MRQTLLRWVMGVIAILVTVWLAQLLRPAVMLEWRPTWEVIVFVPILAIVNSVIGSILRLLSMPITCLTFGLFSFVINALVFWIAGTATGAQMNSWGALFGSIVYAAISTALSWTIKEKRD